MFGLPSPSLAQEGGLSISADYPSMVVGIGETVTLDMTVYSPAAEIVSLEVNGLPEGWAAEFRGGGRVIYSVHVEQNSSADVQLRVTQPANVKAGTYRFTAVARGSGAVSEFPIELIVKEKAPARLSLQSDFPTLRGGTESPFNFNATLKNDGDEDIFVTFTADASREFSVTIKASGKDITNLPTEIKSGASQRIDISVEPLTTLPVGSYPIGILAQGETAEASLILTAEVVGQPQLTLTTPDGALSGEAYLGKSTPIKLVLRNTGNSPAVGVTLSATSPAGWNVTLDPEQVIEVPAEGEVEITANVKPADQAIAGDYMLTFRAQPNEGGSKSTDFRLTVRASTLWGVVGIVLIAVALGIVGLAVMRFGRR
jgi:uncharacterized membrane protein